MYKIITVFSKYMNIINIKYFGFIKIIIDLFPYTISIGEKKKYESEIWLFIYLLIYLSLGFYNKIKIIFVILVIKFNYGINYINIQNHI